MVKIVCSAAVNGIDGFLVSVECVFASNVREKMEIIGLPDTAIREAEGRVRAAAASCNLPIMHGLLTVNLAPASQKKEGTGFDLPILLSVLDTDKLGKINLGGKCFVGELSLTGEIKPVCGVLSMALAAKEVGFSEIFVPYDNAAEASIARGINVIPIRNLKELMNHLKGIEVIEPKKLSMKELQEIAALDTLDFCDVKGQDDAKFALEIAAAGFHNVLMIGPPGSGKSMLAKRLPSIMPRMTLNDAIESTRIHSVAGTLPGNTPLITSRPFRSPHHTVSAAGLAGGGKYPMPGEISLAHNGVLFLDEFPEFDKSTTEILRQPMEDGKVTITRVSGRVTYPCNFMLVAAMNPCKCGYYGHLTKACICSPAARLSYMNKISGPLLDRIDIQIEVQSLEFATLSSESGAEKSADIRQRVSAARAYAAKRFEFETVNGKPLLFNSQMQAEHVKRFCTPTQKGIELLKKAYDSLGLSARGYDKILKLARTVADFDNSEMLTEDHILLAIQLRTLDRNYWGK